MESVPSAMDDWAFYLVALAVAVLVAGLLARKPRRAPLPPGPPAVPIVGPFLFLRRSSRSLFDLEPYLRSLRRRYASDIISLPVRSASRPAIFISDRAATHRALVSFGATFASRPAGSPANDILSSRRHSINTAPYGPVWRALRRNLAAELLHPSRVRLFAPARRRVRDVLLADLSSKAGGGTAPVQVMESFQYAMFCLLVYMCFGAVDETTVKRIERVQRELLGSVLSFNVFSLFPAFTRLLFRNRWQKLLSLRRRQEELFLPLIRARQAKLQQHKAPAGEEEQLVYCYVDSLLALRIPNDGGGDGGRALTEGEMVSLCSELMSAGTDTTSTALQWIMANIVKKPEIQRRVREEVARCVGAGEEIQEEDLQRMEYVKAVVLEGLRRHPPGHFVLAHEVTEETTLDGYRIPKGAPVNFAVAEMGWDAGVWPEPMEFRPERFMPGGEGEGVDLTGSREIKMMPFGAGRRICPGLGLALMHLEYFVANLVRELEWLETLEEPVVLDEKIEFTVVMRRPLKARLRPATTSTTTLG